MKMILKLFIFLIAIFSFVKSSIAQEPKSLRCSENFELTYLTDGIHSFCDEGQWILVFEDEFDGASLDLSKWRESPNQQGGLFLPGWSQEFRTLDNVSVSNGSMNVIAKKETVIRKAFSWKPDDEILADGLSNLRSYNYTSAFVESKFKMPFGRVEASVKIPKGRGFWPGFWLYSGDPWNEIDIFEFMNQYDLNGDFDLLKSVKTQMITIHYDIDNNGDKKQCLTTHIGPDYSALSHEFSTIFNRNKIEFHVDGSLKRYDLRYYTLLGQETGCQIVGGIGYPYLLNYAFPIDPMRIIFSLYIQNKNIVNGIERDDSPDASTPFPSQMEVNWVRYYQQHPYVNVTISNYAQHPVEPGLYNVIAGKNVEIDCNYIVPNEECLILLAENRVKLYPGFHAANGSTLRVKADQNLFEETRKEQRSLDLGISHVDYEAFDEIIEDNDQMIDYIVGNEHEQEMMLPSIVPNPSNGLVQVRLETNEDCYDVYVSDLFGRIVYANKYLSGTNSFVDLSSLSKGVYFVRIFSHSSQQQYIRKLIIQ